ncbi:toxin YhaV [Methylobacterium sp. 174MFSha1.1]|uniref:type II toxin-antitoxin system YhaV family toxin n=1 Tax=Methylobacterium sp. 174MFSha1.1 TaxID=1502749 RepID=UPI0008F1F2FF|nr:type II toxin-antitoxin system YhaV family toxin [Methylobacterium sp. 174MFSha1.1]SFU98052.1 toxin YhaV [Methylobacterium sp. 174MFSha1.1]
MVVNGWTIFAHPLLLDQLERLTGAVAKARAADATGYRRTTQAKLLAMLATLIFETIPADPTRPEYRQGSTLGGDRKHWFRAKFGNGRFRLFFRYDSRTKIIILAWVNDQNTLRTYGAKTDAYRVFKEMLDKGNPPDDWPSLLEAASAEAAIARLKKAKPE